MLARVRQSLENSVVTEPLKISINAIGSRRPHGFEFGFEFVNVLGHGLGDELTDARVSVCSKFSSDLVVHHTWEEIQLFP